MNFHVSVQHKAHCLPYVIKAEPDGIFIAFPQIREQLKEKIFLLKTGQQWVGDAADKLLVQRIGRQIEMQLNHLQNGKENPKTTNTKRRKQAAADSHRSKTNAMRPCAGQPPQMT